MSRIFIVVFLVGLCSKCIAQSKSVEGFSLQLYNNLSLNKVDFKSNTFYTTCKNTYSPSIELEYSKSISRRLVIVGGVEGGEDKYKFIIHSPFNEKNNNNVYRGMKGNIESGVYYSKINIGLFYEFNSVKRITPKVGFCQSLQWAFSYNDLYTEVDVLPSQFYLGRIGYLGNGHSDTHGAELLNSIYFGTNYSLKNHKSVDVGFRVQRKLVMAGRQSNFNYFTTEYRDGFGSLIGTDEFSNTHLSIGLAIGYYL